MKKVVLQYYKNGFEKIVIDGEETIYNIFIPYNSIKSISRVYISDVSESLFWSEVPTVFKKLPVFKIYLFGDNYDDILIYDYKYLVEYCPWIPITKQEIKNNKWLFFGKLIGMRRIFDRTFNHTEWLSDKNECIEGITQLNNIRSQLIDNFNNWCWCSNERKKDSGII